MASKQKIGASALPVGALSDLPEVMRSLGHDPWPFLAEFGIDQATLATPRTPLPVGLYGEVLQAAVDKTRCPHFGVLLGDQGTKLENVGELRFLLLNAATVRQAFDHLVRFVTLVHQPIRMRVTTEQGYTGLSLALAEKTPGSGHLLVAYTVAAVKALRTIIGAQWNPSIVHLAVRRPKNIDPYRRFFGTTVLFDQPDCKVLFATSILDTPRTAGDPQLAEFIFERLCLLEQEAPRDLVGQVRHAIETQLLLGDCDVVRIARMFSCHRKTLHGYLQKFGATFESLLDDTRRALAVRMLEHTNLSIAEIAAALRYSNQAALTRAFRRWHGQSPREWRNQNIGSMGARRAVLRYSLNAGRRR